MKMFHEASVKSKKFLMVLTCRITVDFTMTANFPFVTSLWIGYILNYLKVSPDEIDFNISNKVVSQ